MCGICGIVKFNGENVEQSPIKQMMAKQKHRGPNDEGVFCQNNVGLGFVRLSILDLSISGHQPMFDETHRYAIIFNGEIYNYIELRDNLISQGVSFHTNSDTEVLLKMFIRYGKDCLNKLNGMFAFVVYDTETKELFAARDRFGVKPFYYYTDENQFCFASEIPPILEVYGQKNSANEQAVFDYLAFNRTDQTEQTFFNGIKKLMHGHYLTILGNNIKISRWYNVIEKIKETKTDNGKFKELLIDAVKLRLRSDVPVGVCLSGGLDSSTITSIISQLLGKEDINTFSAVYNKKDKSDESKFIELYSEQLKNMYYVHPDQNTLIEDLNSFITIHAEPIPSTGPYAQYCVMRLAKQHVTVTLDGQGADEILAGYHYFYGFYFKDLFFSLKWGRLLKELYKYTTVHKSLYALKTFAYFLLPKSLKAKARVNQRGYLSEEFSKKMIQADNSSIINDLYQSKNLKSALINHIEFKLEHLLNWNDKNSMCFSVESRTPFLDYRLVEYVLSLPSKYIIKDGFTKAILRNSMLGILPEKIRARRDKKGFSTPQDSWFRTPQFQKIILEIIESDSFKKRGIVDAEKAKNVYQGFLNNNNNNMTKDIWKMIHLELWFRKYIDK